MGAVKPPPRCLSVVGPSCADYLRPCFRPPRFLPRFAFISKFCISVSFPGDLALGFISPMFWLRPLTAVLPTIPGIDRRSREQQKGHEGFLPHGCFGLSLRRPTLCRSLVEIIPPSVNCLQEENDLERSLVSFLLLYFDTKDPAVSREIDYDSSVFPGIVSVLDSLKYLRKVFFVELIGLRHFFFAPGLTPAAA